MKLFLNFSLLTMALTLVIFGCGKKDDVNGGGNPAYQQCIQTQYGCLPQAHCGAGNVLYNNNCISISTGTTTGGQQVCAPPYTGTYPNCYYDPTSGSATGGSTTGGVICPPGSYPVQDYYYGFRCIPYNRY